MSGDCSRNQGLVRRGRVTRPWTAWNTRRLGLAVLLALGLPISGMAQDPAAYFRQNCMSCHTIGGGRMAGPDLKDVTQREDRNWLRDFVMNPQAKISAGDPRALELLAEFSGVVMPTPPGITPQLANQLLDLIEAESALESSQFAGIQVSDAPFTPADVELGKALFTGRSPLTNQAFSCQACHSAPAATLLGGGLGPDLTQVIERLQGRAGLTAWLASPPTPVMQSLFANSPLEPHEVHALVAFFDHAAAQPPRRTVDTWLGYVLLGLGGAALGFVLFDRVWSMRLRAVRRPLVEGQYAGGAR